MGLVQGRGGFRSRVGPERGWVWGIQAQGWFWDRVVPVLLHPDFVPTNTGGYKAGAETNRYTLHPCQAVLFACVRQRATTWMNWVTTDGLGAALIELAHSQTKTTHDASNASYNSAQVAPSENQLHTDAASVGFLLTTPQVTRSISPPLFAHVAPTPRVFPAISVAFFPPYMFRWFCSNSRCRGVAGVSKVW